MAVVEIVIEQLKEEDHARYLEVLVESYSQYEKEYNNPEDWASYLSAIRASVGNPDAATILVAKQGDEILGGLQLFTDSEKAYGLPELRIHSTIVRLLGVHPKGRGLGIAKKNYYKKALPSHALVRIKLYIYIRAISCRLPSIFTYH